MTVLVHHTSNHLSSRSALGSAGSEIALALSNGLTLFFVLSGFLLYRPFVSSLLGDTPRPRIGKYFRNRALRIYPAYLVIFLVATLLMGSAYLEAPALNGLDSVGRITDPWTFVADLLLVQTYFPSTMLSGLGVAWSLTAEVAFYVLLPLMFLAAAFLVRRGLNRTAAALLPPIFMIVVGLAATAFLDVASRGMTIEQLTQFEWGHTWWAVLNRSVIAQADLFGWGMLAAVVLRILHDRGLTRLVVWQRVALLGASIVLGVGGALFGRDISTNIVSIACALLILATVLPGHVAHEPSRFARVLEWLPFRYLGLISYSIYLWHVPVIWWLKQRGLYSDSVLGTLISFAVVALVTVALASVTYYLVEKPAMSLKARTDATKTPVTMV